MPIHLCVGRVEISYYPRTESRMTDLGCPNQVPSLGISAISRPRLIATTLPHPLRLRNQIRLDHRSNLLLPLHLGREMTTCQRSSLHLEEQHNSRPQLLQGAKETNPGQYTSNLLAIRTVASYIVLKLYNACSYERYVFKILHKFCGVLG